MSRHILALTRQTVLFTTEILDLHFFRVYLAAYPKTAIRNPGHPRHPETGDYRPAPGFTGFSMADYSERLSYVP